jgi:hypothetical protein
MIDEKTRSAASPKPPERLQAVRRKHTIWTTREGRLMKTILGALVRGKLTILAVMAALTLGTASVALAGTGVGGVFNLGFSNTVNAITSLVGSVAGRVCASTTTPPTRSLRPWICR